MKWQIWFDTASCSYQINMLTRCNIDLFRQSKKSLRGFPSVSILPRIRPKAVQKTNRPNILIPSEVPCTGTLSSIRVLEMLWGVGGAVTMSQQQWDEVDIYWSTIGIKTHLVLITGMKRKKNLTVVTHLSHIDDTKTVSGRNTTGIKCFMLDTKNKQM